MRQLNNSLRTILSKHVPDWSFFFSILFGCEVVQDISNISITAVIAYYQGLTFGNITLRKLFKFPFEPHNTVVEKLL